MSRQKAEYILKVYISHRVRHYQEADAFIPLTHSVCVCVCECKEPTSFQFPEKEQKILLINPPLVF